MPRNSRYAIFPILSKERKIYSRYVYNRGLQVLWKGAAAVVGSKRRSIALNSDDLNSTHATFQALALEGIGQGIRHGKFAGTDGDPKVLYDQDIDGLEDAAKKFDELVNVAEGEGFRRITFKDIIRFEEKARQG